MDAGAALSCSGALETDVTCRSVSCCNDSRDSSSLSAPRALTDGIDIPAMPPARRMPSLLRSPARLPRVDPIPALPGGTTQVPVSYVSKAHFGARYRKLLNSSRRTTTKGPHKSDGELSVKRSRYVSACVSLAGVLLASAVLAAQAPPAATAPPGTQGQPATQRPMVSCVRGGLQYAVNLYLAAQAKGDLSALPLANGVGYQENMQAADIKTGFLSKPLVIDKNTSLLDTATCQTFTEIIVTNKAEPYVAGVRMRVNHDKIAEVEVLWTTTGYWLFNANAYLDAFLEAKIDLVPWGFPCVRIEGGMYTGKGRNDDSCEAGVPAGVNIANRRFVVDEVNGAVVALCTFGAGGPNGGSGAPDSHLFRVESGKLRYVHTLTHLLQNSFRGNASPAAQPARPAGAPPAAQPAPPPAQPAR